MPIHRRTFLKATGAISAATILKPSIVFGTKANSAIRMGIIGCGNRGTAVISSFLKNTNTNIVAMADLFEDKLQAAKNKFNKLNTDKNFSEIPQQNMYHGSKAYLQLLENKDVDAVLISSPAYTHPWFLEAAVDAGKHVYCEKPVAPDIAGCKKVLQIGEKLNKNLSAVIGFQIRYATPYVEMVKRIQQGNIGDLISAQLYYFSSGSPVYELKNVSDDELQKSFTLKANGQVIYTAPKIQDIGTTINHWVHHRGQLTVYMRLNDIAVPSIYGPSADDKNF